MSRPVGETPELLADVRPQWFTPRFGERLLGGGALSVDQPDLLSMIAPRPLYVASASEDDPADPEGEFLSLVWAAEAWDGAEKPWRPSFPGPGGKRWHPERPLGISPAVGASTRCGNGTGRDGSSSPTGGSMGHRIQWYQVVYRPCSRFGTIAPAYQSTYSLTLTSKFGWRGRPLTELVLRQMPREVVDGVDGHDREERTSGGASMHRVVLVMNSSVRGVSQSTSLVPSHIGPAPWRRATSPYASWRARPWCR